MFNKLRAFFVKDFLTESSYNLAFFMRLGSIFFSVITFFFMARLFGSAASPYLQQYGGDFFSFIILGIAFSNYLYTSLHTFSSSIRKEQSQGTLEFMLLSPTPIFFILIGSSLWKFFLTTLEVLTYILIGAFFFGLNVSQADFFATFVILVLTIVCFSSFGIISASFIMVFKRGDPLNWLMTNVAAFLGGVFFPIAILPGWVQFFSNLIPLTYALRGIRLAILKGYSVFQLSQEISILTLFCFIFIPISIACFNFALRKAKMDGSLTHY